MKASGMEIFKEWLGITVFHNTVQDYAYSLAVMLTLVLTLHVSKRFVIRQLERWTARTETDLDDFLVSLMAKIGAPTFVIISLYLATRSLTLNPPLDRAIHAILVITLTIRVVIVLQQTIQYSIRKAYLRSHPSDPTAEALSKNFAQILRWAVWALGLVFVLDNLGVNISALVAGIGIGGVAVALAAQAILGDLFSAISIFVDKPFIVGDFIVVGDMMGTIEHIGLKTTRIRSLSGEQLIFPNSDLTKSRIRNYKRMDIRRIEFRIGVSHRTPMEKIKKLPGLIQGIIKNMQGVKLDRVHWLSFGDFSLVYEIVYFVQSADYNVYMDKQQELNFAIKETLEREGVELAHPVQTVYLTDARNEESKNGHSNGKAIPSA